MHDITLKFLTYLGQIDGLLFTRWQCVSAHRATMQHGIREKRLSIYLKERGLVKMSPRKSILGESWLVEISPAGIAYLDRLLLAKPKDAGDQDDDQERETKDDADELTDTQSKETEYHIRRQRD